jgi:hypothetical protein
MDLIASNLGQQSDLLWASEKSKNATGFKFRTRLSLLARAPPPLRAPSSEIAGGDSHNTRTGMTALVRDPEGPSSWGCNQPTGTAVWSIRPAN